MNRTIQFGDRRPLEPRMDYCRLDYEFNQDAAETLNLTIQIFDQGQTQFLQRYPELTPARTDALIQQVLGQGWNNVLTQKFQDWAVCYLQRPKVAVSAQPMAARSVAAAPLTHHARVKTAQQASQKTTRQQRHRARSPRRLSPWKQAKTIGARIAAVGFAAGAIALGIKGAQTLASIDASRAIAALEQPFQNHRHQSPQAAADETKVSGELILAPITPVDNVQNDPFQQAVVLAEQAVLEGRVADSAQDWKDLAMQWHEAAGLMKQVPNSDQRYALAQNRADAYSERREQSLIETALRSVVFPIENRQRISSPDASDSSAANSSAATSSSTAISAQSFGSKNRPPGESQEAGSSAPNLAVSAIQAMPGQANAPSPTASPNSCQTVVGKMIEPILTAPSYQAGQWGLYVQSLSSGQVLYQRNGNDFFVPASNIKLYTTAAAVTWLAQAQAQASAAQASAKEVSGGGSNLSVNVAVPAIASPEAGNPVPNVTDIASDFPILIQNANLHSNNWSAEILLEKMGGPTVVKELLDTLGIDPIGYHQADGSGLSRSNLVTPKSLVETLAVMRSAAGSATFHDTLPIAGQRGTLYNRFRNTVAYGKVRAKTGTLLGVRSLSGYLEHPIHGPVAFSIVVNYPGHSGYGLNSPIDQMVVQLMQLGDCSTNP
ncbi:MAG: D-alanyl-D-alanine carboxypeptidase [Elainellaceae cyanobacterium]